MDSLVEGLKKWFDARKNQKQQYQAKNQARLDAARKANKERMKKVSKDAWDLVDKQFTPK